MDTGMRACKDCEAEGITTRRPVTHPGPRCTTHHRAFKNAQSERKHAAHIEKTYGITDKQYAQLYEYQGGRCWICRRATGASKRLAVDHNHKTGEVRGLLCGSGCNRGVLGHLRDDPEALRRAADYLENPPARACFNTNQGEHQ